MSYLVLARKYRPRNFSEMVGQEHVVQALTNALTQQRLHHAYLFTGTRGVGKTTVSRILAKSLNCTGPDGQGSITASPCGVCAACTDIDSGRFPDYTELDAASNRGVDEVQGLLEQAVYKPVQGRFKVFMIDEVHMLTNTAFNAMLKTLEEPPEYLKFVLATTDPQKVPVTVLSRCLQFNLRPMAPETVLQHLTAVLDKEAIPAEPQALRLLARAARGSMRDALSLTDQAIAFGAGQLQEAGVRQMLGSVDSSYVYRCIDALAQGDGAALVDIVDTLRLQGLSAAATLEDMATSLQRMAVFQAVPDKARAAMDSTDPDEAELLRLSQAMAPDETQLLYSICLHGRGELGLAPDEYAALTMTLLRLLAFKPADALAEKKTPSDGVAALADSRQKPAPTQNPPAPEAPIVVAKNPPPAAPPVVQPAPAPAVQAAPAPEAASAPPALKLPVRTPEDLIPSRPVAPAAAVPAVAEAQPPAAEEPDEEATYEAEGDDGAQDSPPPYDGPPDEAYWDGAYGDDAPPPEAPAQHAADAPLVELPVQEPELSPYDRPTPGAGDSMVRVPAEFTPSPEGDFWHTTVQKLVAEEAITAVTRQLALRSQLMAREGDCWRLQVDLESLAQPATVERLRTALVAAGLAGRIEVARGPVSDCPARRNAHAAQLRQRAAEALVQGDPYVRSLVEQFGAKIVPGSIQPV
ncbi:MAG: DNA polymerase III subunit gamma/tau [Comamonas sp.]